MLGLIAAILVVFLRRLVHDPVQALLNQTEQVGRGNLDVSVDTVSTDELGDLSRAFNHMTQSLKKARCEFEDLAHNLESKVEERTKEVRQMQAQLVRSEKLASLGELVAGIAHELNNPLTGILVFSSLLSSKAGLDEATKGDIDVIVHETQRCATIVKGLLEFSRESIPAKRPCSLNEIMEKTLSLIGHQSFFHDIAIHKSYDDGMPPTLADPNQMEQVFINMLLNASQSMAGRGDLMLRTGVSSNSKWAYVEIEDTGCGIPEENLPKIFDPFFTTKESKGTGLGLSVSYGIVENHGGKIEVHSTVGKGTTFAVLLPLGELAPQPSAN
jgi:two-component system NtrC family sensor kinase